MANNEDEGERLRKEAKRWLDRIDAATKSEKLWADDADKAVAVYTSEGTRRPSDNDTGVPMFNILFSNVETIVPATINSPPAPDIRRRFDTNDPIAQRYAEILERAMRIQVDDGRLQVELEAEAQDAFLAGRGLIRIRFKSDFEVDEADPAVMQEEAEAERERYAEEDDGEEPAAPVERARNERIEFEVVSWRDFRRGPAKRWRDIPWGAFSHSIAFDEYKAFCDSDLVRPQEQEGDKRISDPAVEEVKVWEVWDKASRTVIFIDEEKVRIIKRVPDPLGLSNFFPIHDPVQPIEVTGRLMPVNPYKIYCKLAEELDITTKRIAAITQQLRVKGWYAGSAADFSALLEAGDNEFVPLQDEGLWASKGGVEGAVGFWPVDKLVLTLRELYALREQTKQAIYEITGISDIVRGASRSNETATAQQIKTQWGSLRIQKMQRQLENAGRQIFLMMAEIIPTKFSFETLEKITGIQIVPTEQDLTPVQPQVAPNATPEQVQQAQQQAQQAEQARVQKLNELMQLQALMKERASTYFRIDVETDSTIKADLTRQKQEAAEFMGAASQYFQAVAPLVQQGALPMEIAVEIFGSFTRLYNLGKTVDDALDELVEKAKEKSKQPSQQKPSPDQIKAEADAKAKEQEMQLRGQEAQLSAASHQADMQAKQAEQQQKMASASLDMQIRQREAEADLAGKVLDQQTKQVELTIKQTDLQIRQADLALKQKQMLMPSRPIGEAA